MLGAVAALGAADPRGVYWAGRLTLCAEPDDLPVYDAAFAAYFGGRRNSPRRLPTAPTLPNVAAPFVSGPPPASGETPDEQPAVLGLSASTDEVLRQRDV